MISTLDRIESLGNSSLGMIEEQRDFVRDSLKFLEQQAKYPMTLSWMLEQFRADYHFY